MGSQISDHPMVYLEVDKRSVFLRERSIYLVTKEDSPLTGLERWGKRSCQREDGIGCNMDSTRRCWYVGKAHQWNG